MARVLTAAVLLILLWLPTPAAAQPDVVAAVKADLVARGVSIVDACGAFQITARVAWRLRATGAGLLDKPNGTQCQGRAVDIIAYPGGGIVDILIDAGGANGPTWALGEPVDASRWRAPTDPGDGPPVVVPPVVVPPYQPPPVAIDLGPVYQRLDSLSAQTERMFADLTARDAARAAQVAAVDQRLEAHDTKPGWLKAVFTNGKTYAAIVGVLGGVLANKAAP